jgi:hypothetical protein
MHYINKCFPFMLCTSWDLCWLLNQKERYLFVIIAQPINKLFDASFTLYFIYIFIICSHTTKRNEWMRWVWMWRWFFTFLHMKNVWFGYSHFHSTSQVASAQLSRLWRMYHFLSFESARRSWKVIIRESLIFKGKIYIFSFLQFPSSIFRKMSAWRSIPFLFRFLINSKNFDFFFNYFFFFFTRAWENK